MSEFKTKIVWVVFQNTDLTEGRGHEVPIAVCESRSTAIRLSKKKGVQGTDASVRQWNAISTEGTWLAPVQIVKPSKEDLQADQTQAEFQAVIDRAKALGLTVEDLKVLARAQP